MLNRAATSAYSWWWASHIRTKQSKWLEQNLKDMEEKINFMLKVIDQDGDSFAKRAEMYYKKRPELISSVEESYKAYRSLAERFDHLSKDFQAANRTIATVFPEHVQLAMDSEDDDSMGSTVPLDRDWFPTSNATMPKNMPKAPKLPKQNVKAQTLLASKREQVEKNLAADTLPSGSGLSKEEALKEIDTLQKQILAMQTEKEFVKNAYESALAKFSELENKITESQSKVCALEDEFGVGTIMEEHEARSLMAESALKSCFESLDKLKDEQKRSRNEVEGENRRIIEAHKRLDTIKKLHGQHNEYDEDLVAGSKGFEETLDHIELEEGENVNALRERLRDQLKLNSNLTFTESEMAEKIDDLVQKIASLEMGLCSQNALVRRLREDIDALLRHIKSLEEQKESFVEASTMRNRCKELEEELRSVKILNKEILDRKNNINGEITEVDCKLDHLQQKLPDVKSDEGNNLLFSSNEKKFEQETKTPVEELEKDMEDENDDVMFNSEKYMKDEDEEEEEDKQDTSKMPESTLDIDTELDESGGFNWRQLHLNNLEDREKTLVEEYSMILRDYKDLKMKLNKLKKEHRDNINDLTSQVSELRNIIATKDQEIQMLRKKLSAHQNCGVDKANSAVQEHMSLKQEPNDSKEKDVLASDTCDPDRKPLFHHLYDRNAVIEQQTTNDNEKESSTDVPTEKRVKINLIVKSKPVSKTESRFRGELDDLLESNLDFWLRFSTSFHQIQKFQNSIKDLQSELVKLKDTQKKEGPDKLQQLKSDARPIYKHLREIETELTLWLEHNSVFQEELRSRFTSLNNIQDEIMKLPNANANEKERELNDYQEAKFQGEILNMKQENNKVAGELQAGVHRVKSLKVEVAKALAKLEKDYGFADLKSRSSSVKNSSNKSKTPFHSFLFGMKLKKHKKPST